MKIRQLSVAPLGLGVEKPDRRIMLRPPRSQHQMNQGS